MNNYQPYLKKITVPLSQCQDPEIYQCGIGQYIIQLQPYYIEGHNDSPNIGYYLVQYNEHIAILDINPQYAFIYSSHDQAQGSIEQIKGVMNRQTHLGETIGYKSYIDYLQRIKN